MRGRREIKAKVKMTFEVLVDKDSMIDDETLMKEYKNDIHRLAKYLYKEEGFWWDEEMKLIKTEVLFPTKKVKECQRSQKLKETN